MKQISRSVAVVIFEVSSALLFLFHILVLMGVVPIDLVWGGNRGNSGEDIVVLEVVALVVTLVFALVVFFAAVKPVNSRLLTFGVWLVFGYMLLNIFTNLAYGSGYEKLIFTPISMLMAFSSLIVALGRRS